MELIGDRRNRKRIRETNRRCHHRGAQLVAALIFLFDYFRTRNGRITCVVAPYAIHIEPRPDKSVLNGGFHSAFATNKQHGFSTQTPYFLKRLPGKRCPIRKQNGSIERSSKTSRAHRVLVIIVARKHHTFIVAGQTIGESCPGSFNGGIHRFAAGNANDSFRIIRLGDLNRLFCRTGRCHPQRKSTAQHEEYRYHQGFRGFERLSLRRRLHHVDSLSPGFRKRCCWAALP